MRWRRRKDPDRDSDEALYIHLAGNGDVLLIRGDTGEERWTDRKGLQAELDRISDRPHASLLYSREDPQVDPSDEVRETFEMVVDYELPIQLLEDPHPTAGVPPERRDVERTE